MNANELIKRLREPVEDGVPIPVCRLLDEAADLLASQAAEIEKLREALRPFARMHLPWRDGGEIVTVTYGDLRRARQALEGTGAAHG